MVDMGLALVLPIITGPIEGVTDDEIALVKTENGGRSWMMIEPWLVP